MLAGADIPSRRVSTASASWQSLSTQACGLVQASVCARTDDVTAQDGFVESAPPQSGRLRAIVRLCVTFLCWFKAQQLLDFSSGHGSVVV